MNFSDRNAVERFLEGKKFRHCANLQCSPVELEHQVLYMPMCIEGRFKREGLAEVLDLPHPPRPLSPVTYTTIPLWAPLVSCPAGIAEFVPVVGPLVAALSIFGVAYLTNYSHLWLLLAFLGVWRLVQDYYNSPRIMGGNLELHPLAALFAILVGGELGGVLGVFLSIPIMATLRILWRRWHAYSEPQDSGSRLHADHDGRAA